MPVVSRHMSRDLLTVEPDVLLVDAAKRMVARSVGAVLVVEGERLVGILTERDMLRAVAAGIEDGARVAGWMTRHPDTIEASDSTDHAVALMIHGGFRHLPVVERGKTVGILSIRDLVRVTLEDKAPRGA